MKWKNEIDFTTYPSIHPVKYNEWYNEYNLQMSPKRMNEINKISAK